jgi:hypothetical protein
MWMARAYSRPFPKCFCARYGTVRRHWRVVVDRGLLRAFSTQVCDYLTRGGVGVLLCQAYFNPSIVSIMSGLLCGSLVDDRGTPSLKKAKPAGRSRSKRAMSPAGRKPDVNTAGAVACHSCLVQVPIPQRWVDGCDIARVDCTYGALLRFMLEEHDALPVALYRLGYADYVKDFKRKQSLRLKAKARAQAAAQAAEKTAKAKDDEEEEEPAMLLQTDGLFADGSHLIANPGPEQVCEFARIAGERAESSPAGLRPVLRQSSLSSLSCSASYDNEPHRHTILRLTLLAVPCASAVRLGRLCPSTIWCSYSATRARPTRSCGRLQSRGWIGAPILLAIVAGTHAPSICSAVYWD